MCHFFCLLQKHNNTFIETGVTSRDFPRAPGGSLDLCRESLSVQIRQERPTRKSKKDQRRKLLQEHRRDPVPVQLTVGSASFRIGRISCPSRHRVHTRSTGGTPSPPTTPSRRRGEDCLITQSVGPGRLDVSGPQGRLGVLPPGGSEEPGVQPGRVEVRDGLGVDEAPQTVHPSSQTEVPVRPPAPPSPTPIRNPWGPWVRSTITNSERNP